MSHDTPTRPGIDIEPFVPRLPADGRPDGPTPPRESPRRPFDRPPQTDYAAECSRHTEEIEPGVPDLR